MASKQPSEAGPYTDTPSLTPQLPPDIATARSLTVDEFIADMEKMPLFMQNMDPEDSNPELDAFKALIYEGPPEEVAQNFRIQGNESFKIKKWRDAIEFYTKALRVKCGDKAIDEACYANRAACNLELQNYRQTNLDCLEALKLNPSNVKAWYRSARACLAIDKIGDARECIVRGLYNDKDNVALQALSRKVESQAEYVTNLANARREREERKKTMEIALKTALKDRNIKQRTTSSRSPDLPPDATIKLSDPVDPASILLFPTVFLYPLEAQSDFVTSQPEDSTFHVQLKEILSPHNPPPWDTEKEYRIETIDIYVERKKYDMHGKAGLSKVGKKITLGKTLEEGKVEVCDGVVSCFVVPKKRAEKFIKGWKEKNPI